MDFDKPLGEIAEIVMGQSPKKEDVNDLGNGLPLLNGPTEFTARHPLPVQFTSNGKKFSQKGDVLFCVRGSTTGRMNYSDQSYAIGRGIAAIRGRSGYPTPYVRAVIEHSLDRLLTAATGSTFPNVGKDLINSFLIKALEIGEAEKVSQIITSIDAKIELNRQINQTLEEMAQAIFKSWFVDFDPVKAKMLALENGGTEEDANLAAMKAISGKSIQQLETMQAENPNQYQQLHHTASLFPSAMQESELGEVPAGWGITTLGEIAPYPKDRLGIESLELETFISTENMLSEKQGVQIASKLPTGKTSPAYQKGDVLVSNIRPYFKKIWLASHLGGRSGDVLAFRPVKPELTSFVYMYLYQDSFFDFMMQTSKGAKMPRGDKEAIQSKKLVMPTEELIGLFSKKVESMFDLIAKNRSQSKILAELRDSLLPKLLSGELLISNESNLDKFSSKFVESEATENNEIVIESAGDLAGFFAKEDIIFSRRKTQFSERPHRTKDMLCYLEKAIVDTKKNTIIYHRFSLEIAKENLKKLFTTKSLTIGTVSTVISDRIGDAEAIYDFFSNSEAQISAGLISLVIGTSYAVKRLFSKEEVSAYAVAIITSLSQNDGALSQPRLFQISNEILKGLKISEMDFMEFNNVMKLLKDKCGLVRVTANRNWYLPETVEFKD